MIDSDNNQNVDKPYNLRKIRSKTAYEDFDRTFYDYDYNLCQRNENSNIIRKGVCATQLSSKKGIKIFGNKAVPAIVDDYEQLDRPSVFEPIHGKSLTCSQRLNALNVIDLIKQKRYGKIKGRTVADGRKKRDFYSKFETSSPALSLEGFLGTLAIDAAEDIAIADVTGAFLKADINDFVIVKLQGAAIEALMKMNKNRFKDFVIKNTRNDVLYVKP